MVTPFSCDISLSFFSYARFVPLVMAGRSYVRFVLSVIAARPVPLLPDDGSDPLVLRRFCQGFTGASDSLSAFSASWEVASGDLALLETRGRFRLFDEPRFWGVRWLGFEAAGVVEGLFLGMVISASGLFFGFPFFSGPFFGGSGSFSSSVVSPSPFPDFRPRNWYGRFLRPRFLRNASEGLWDTGGTASSSPIRSIG